MRRRQIEFMGPITIFLMVLLVACTAAVKEGDLSSPQVEARKIRDHTILPGHSAISSTTEIRNPEDIAGGVSDQRTDFDDYNLIPMPRESVVFPAGIFLEGLLVRPRVEMRTGPGMEFNLADQILTENTKVLLFERVGIWQKIYVRELQKFGWVHHEVIGNIQETTEDITVQVNRLPTVITVRNVDHVFLYPKQDPQEIKIPRGIVFSWICSKDDKILIWLKQTNSAVWLSKEDVR